MNTRQILFGVFFLVLGLSLYVFYRRMVPFFPVPSNAILSPSNGLGLLGGFLPSFIHALAFCLISAGVLNACRRADALVCVFWGSAHVAVELGQHQAVFAVIAPFLEVPFIRGYFEHGTFDTRDVLAAIAGCVLAYYLLLLTRDQSNRISEESQHALL